MTCQTGHTGCGKECCAPRLISPTDPDGATTEERELFALRANYRAALDERDEAKRLLAEAAYLVDALLTRPHAVGLPAAMAAAERYRKGSQ